ncbi:unnamed protein product [Pylaiella littoralis]
MLPEWKMKPPSVLVAARKEVDQDEQSDIVILIGVPELEVGRGPGRFTAVFEITNLGERPVDQQELWGTSHNPLGGHLHRCGTMSLDFSRTHGQQDDHPLVCVD